MITFFKYYSMNVFQSHVYVGLQLCPRIICMHMCVVL